MNRFPSRCASCSQRRLSPRTDITHNKRDAGDNRSPDSDHFCQNSRIFGRHCPAAVERLAGLLRFRPMKPFLNLLREFGEIHLRDSRFSFKHKPIPFDAAHRRVFVDLAVSGFEVLRRCEGREQDCQNHGSTILHSAAFCRFSSPHGNGKMMSTARVSHHPYGLPRPEGDSKSP
jgi:hypothetical protein